MNSPLVHLLLRVPTKQFRFKKPDFWRADGGEYSSHPRWDVDIFIVSNEAGLQYVKPDLLVTRLRDASLAIGGHALTAKCTKYPTAHTHHSSLSSGPSGIWRYMPKRSAHGHLLQGRHSLPITQRQGQNGNMQKPSGTQTAVLKRWKTILSGASWRQLAVLKVKQCGHHHGAWS